MKPGASMVKTPDTKLIDLRTVIAAYRKRWRRQQEERLKLLRP
jgi:hypothetical protein